jgi:hypothetical protein
MRGIIARVTVTGEIDITYPVFRGMALSFLGVGLVLVRIFGLTFIVASLAGGALVLPVVLLLVVGGGPELGIWIAWRMRRDQIAGPNRFEVSASAVDVHRRSGDLHVEWADVARVRRGRHSWTVRRAGLRELMIPRAAFSAEDRTRVNDFFLAHPEFAG